MRPEAAGGVRVVLRHKSERGTQGRPDPNQRDRSVGRVTSTTQAAGGADCHYLPQRDYAEGVDHVFCTMAETWADMNH